MGGGLPSLYKIECVPLTWEDTCPLLQLDNGFSAFFISVKPLFYGGRCGLAAPGWRVALLDVFAASPSPAAGLLYWLDLLAVCNLMILIDGWLSCVSLFLVSHLYLSRIK